MIVLREPSEQLEPSANARDIKLLTEVALILGWGDNDKHD